jgi:density-regulated protein DRP1
MSFADAAGKNIEVVTPGKPPLVNGPIDGETYPKKVVYCGECSLPLEYCYLNADFGKCKDWLERHLPDLFDELYLKDKEGEDGDEGEGGKKSGRQKRGGKGLAKPKKKNVDRHVGIARANRGKKKYVTVVTGLSTFDVDVKDAAKFFASKFACGSSVTGPDEIVIQGDVKDDLFELISEKWPQIDEDFVEDLGDRKL